MKDRPTLIAGCIFWLIVHSSLAISQDKDSITRIREPLFQSWQLAVKNKEYETAATRQAELLPLERQLFQLAQSDASMDEKVYAGSFIYALNGVASRLSQNHQHGEASSLYKEAYQVMQKFLSEGNWQLTDSRLLHEKEQRKATMTRQQLSRLQQADEAMQQVAALYKQGKLKEAVPLAQSSLVARRELLGEEFTDTVACLAYLGLIHKYLKNFDEAENVYREAFRICEEHLGYHSNTAKMCTNLGKLYQETRDFVEAEPLLRRAHEIKKSLKGAAHIDTTASLNALAELYDVIGDRDRREQTLLELLPLRKQAMGEDHVSLAAIHSNLGLLYKKKGQFDRSEAHFLDSIAIWERRGTSDDPKAAFSSTLNNLGELYRAMGEFAKAEAIILRAIDDKKQKLGDAHSDTAIVINNLGNVYFEQGEYEKAEASYQKAFGIKSPSGSSSVPSSATALDNLGSIYYVKQEYPKAADFYKKAYDIRRKHLGDHLDTARSLNNLGLIYSATNSKEKAISYLDESCQMMERLYGKAHPQRIFFLNNLARIKRTAGHRKEALLSLNDCRRATHSHISRVLPGLPEGRQLQFLQSRDRPSLDFGLSMVLASTTPSPFEINTSAEWILNGKATALEAIAKRNRPGSGKGSEEAHQLELTRTRLATLSLKKPPELSATDYRKQISDLRDSESRLAAKIGMELALTSSTWIPLEAIREELPANAVLIELVRFQKQSFNSSKAEVPHYAAWIIRKEGAVSLVDLGPAKAVEDSISALGKELSRSPERMAEVNEEEAYRELAVASTRVSERCLLPLLPEIKDASRLIISPDSNLWLIPWAILPLSDGSFAVEKFEIDLLISGRNLVRRESIEVTTSPPAVFADPDFDLSVKATKEAPQGLVKNRGAAATLPNFFRLPGTAREAQSILPSLQGFSSGNPVAFLGDGARESSFKSLSNPGLLVFSTHGFFQAVDPNNSVSSTRASLPFSREDSDEDHTEFISNPLLRCGLALAGCNKAGENGEDGILTGLEITSRDLRGTSLVVLSACETGLGEVRNGEGVAGLRQAFQIAGAGNVLSTLWQIPDEETADLMSRFFEELSQGASVPASLRKAQTAQIVDRREKHGAAHPIFWGAFTTTR